jgi:beta-carotene 3-hydroxylase
MNTLIAIVTFTATFGIMEFMAWFIHKYIMHGILWSLHKDHHHKDHNSWFERNDAFFLFFAGLSMFFLMFAKNYFWLATPIGLGILAYGIAYFVVHDIFIHQRFKWLRTIDNAYARGLRRAHKIHHKHLGKEKGENFGMLLVPKKYFK